MKGGFMDYNFDSIEIHQTQYHIKNGTIGTFEINNIKKVKIVYEQASFKGKTEPFLHQYIGGASFFTAMEPKIYVGVQVLTKDGGSLAIYVSDQPVLYHSDLFLHDQKIAERILKKLNELMNKK